MVSGMVPGADFSVPLASVRPARFGIVASGCSYRRTAQHASMGNMSHCGARILRPPIRRVMMGLVGALATAMTGLAGFVGRLDGTRVVLFGVAWLLGGGAAVLASLRRKKDIVSTSKPPGDAHGVSARIWPSLR